ncbi:MAG: hypothetical protein KKC75_07995 [Nanoarchaeota archaeon]|nr:hypothetical protein [Nanoarchaeota archaeon]MBU1005271.1 hypothetical protein [Nanoarchaeota archaeon]MBU1947008.1 hypothetical protein [Nanoarchaeota archaeon]
MAFFGAGKKKEDNSQAMPPDMGAYPDQGYSDPNAQQGQDQGYDPNAQYGQGQDQGYGQYPPQGGMQQMPPPQMPMDQGSGSNHESIQEIAEAVVEEKWNEKKRELEKITEWKEEVTTKLAQLQQKIDDINASFDSLHKGVLGKITEYDENLTNVGTEIKAMEKVFSKVLPSLTESVNKLDRFSSAGSAVKKK